MAVSWRPPAPIDARVPCWSYQRASLRFRRALQVLAYACLLGLAKLCHSAPAATHTCMHMKMIKRSWWLRLFL
eukprot:3010078-Pleurochrysis_carterae.AAC.2